MKSKLVVRIGFFALLLIMISCAPYKHLNEQVDVEGTKNNRFKMAKQEFEPVKSDPYQNGSLFQASDVPSLFTDTKALRKNDIVTIVVSESSKADKSAESSVGRKSSLSAKADHSALGMKSLMNESADSVYSLSGESALDWSGSGKTSRSGSLSGTITAVIKEVLPNGNFQIEGKRIITVNNEEQIMTLTGIIRPEDISGANTINSTKIANAKIEYSGRGIINDVQHPGWFARIFAWIWPL